MKRSLDNASQLRHHRFFLIIIALVTLSLTILMMISLYHENEQRKVRTTLDVREDGERLAIECERQTWNLSEKCLRDPELAELAPLLVAAAGPDGIHDINAQLLKFSQRHPIAEHFFVFQNGEVRFPQRVSQKTLISPYKVASKKAATESQFVKLLESAESEKSQGRLANAIKIYQQAYDLAVPDGLKALALKNQAFCYAQIQKPTDAVRAYHQLEDRYGDYTDEYNQPFAVIAAIEIEKIAGKSSATNAEHFVQLYEQLINGRWLLSEEDTKSCQALLKKRLGKREPASKETPYLRHFQIGRSLENLLDIEKSSETDRIQTQSIVQGDAAFQVFYLPLQGNDRTSRVIALSVNPSFVSGPLLAECRALLHGKDSISPEFQIVPHGSSPGSELDIPFRTIFPFLELNLSKQAIAKSKTNEFINIFMSIASLVLLIILLALVVILGFRVSREITLLRMRSDFLTSISHEHKTPLAIILLYCETLLADENLMADERRQCYRIIHREAERLNNLIKNTLLFSGIENKKHHYALKEGDLGAVVDKTVKSCEDWLVKQGFTVKTAIAPNLPPVLFDAEKVTQALINLIDNARKYSDKSRSLNVQLNANGSEVILEVRDTGSGIPDAEKEKIFEKFYRGRNADSQSGSGLGLFLVDDTVKAHKGRITVESQVGYGSCFRLVFPTCGTSVANEF
jgi:signal transduction histidine kinase